MSSAAPVGRLACQMNSQLQRLTTRVVSCTKVDAPPPAKGASTRTKDREQASPAASPVTADEPSCFFEVVCEDSVLFPEGGGQPCDLGTIGGIPVTAVQRRGDTCIIKVPEAIEEGREVEQVVDWQRRTDHIQHHSGQHLLTAIVERELKLPTESWALSQPTCYLQLPTPAVAADDVARVEKICNDYIRSGVPVSRAMYESRADMPEARSRSIPQDVTGPIRLITIDGIDTCTCCGTHVASLSELVCMKILHQEKKGSTCKLHFIFGDRVLQQFDGMYDRERALQAQLGLPPPQFLDGVKRSQKSSTDLQKAQKKLLAELATLVAPQVVRDAAPAADDASPTPFLWHREDVDMDFLQTLSTALADPKAEGGSVASRRMCVLAAGALKSTAVDGQIVIVGPSPDAIKAFADGAMTALGGKGGLSKQGFRGKCDLRRGRRS